MTMQEVVWAQTHSPVFIKGLGNYKDTLDASAEGPDKSMKMFLSDNTLLLITKGHTVAIPLTNVKHMLLVKGKAK